MKSLRKLSLFLLIAGLFISCTKKEIPGPQGEPGPQGQAGPAGKSVTATYSYFIVDSMAWSLKSDGATWEAVVTNLKITSEVAEKGLVKLYAQNDQTWWELPYAIERDLFLQYGVERELIRFECFETHGVPPRPATRNFRLIIVPANP